MTGRRISATEQRNSAHRNLAIIKHIVARIIKHIVARIIKHIVARIMKHIVAQIIKHIVMQRKLQYEDDHNSAMMSHFLSQYNVQQ